MYRTKTTFAFLLPLLFAACGGETQNVGPLAEFAAASAKLDTFIQHEMEDKNLPALSVVLVDGQNIVYAAGFGLENIEDGVPASAGTVHRIGSVSKLFTDIGVMQLVERGELDLDVPVTAYLPGFTPNNTFGGDITLRHLMAHRGGLVREPPVGHYFDDSSPSLAQTVASMSGTDLVYPPGSRTKYSNAGIATVGYVLENVQGEPFARYLKSAVLEPLGMDGSSFAPESVVVDRLADAVMWSYHGPDFPAPTFELGMSPAGSMYAPITDLGKFMKMLFADGVGERGRVLQSETLAEMFTPQFAETGATAGYGLGFRLGQLDGHRYVGHGGAIYGFSTELGALLDDGVGAAAVATVDGAGAVVDRVVSYALRLMLAVESNRELPDPQLSEPVSSELLSLLEGEYANGTDSIRILSDANDLFIWFGDVRVRLRSLGNNLVVDDRLSYGTSVVPTSDGILLGGRSFQRARDVMPTPLVPRWRDLIGEYGWDFNVLYVYEDRGQLHGLIEWFFDYPLQEIDSSTFAFPDRGLYHGEQMVFEREGDEVVAVVAAGIRFPKRQLAGSGTFTIEPIRPVEELRSEALVSSPPVEEGDFLEPDLVELRDLDATIQYDIRYASTNNFMQAVFYQEPHAFMQRPAAQALVRAHRALAQNGYGLLIHDAYRPWYVTKMFWDATPDSQRIFVANPQNGSRHNRGAAVDLTLYNLATGEPVEMVGGYDEFSDRSFPRYPGGTDRQRWHRELLRDAMEAQGFHVYEFEWWHFDYGDWAKYPILNRTFEELGTP